MPGFPADSLIALRDRALLATMAYTFAREGAVLALKVKDYYVQDAAATKALSVQ